MLKSIVIASAVVCLASPAIAGKVAPIFPHITPGDTTSWDMMPGTSSSQLAQDGGWSVVGMTGLSWPDGRQVVVTLWVSKTTGEYFRCNDYFNDSMQGTGGICSRPNADSRPLPPTR